MPALALTLASPAAIAANDKKAEDRRADACAEASEKGQELRDQGKLTDARRLLVECSADTCPAVVRADCIEWLASVDQKMPSIVVRARNHEGRDQAAVRVLVDGRELASSLDGRALPLDPGEHKLRFEQAGSEAVEQSLLVREGEKNRLVDVVIGAPSSPPPSSPPRLADSDREGGFRVPVASWILGGLAIAGGAGFTYFGLRAKNDVDEMRSTCAPGCDPARVDAARRDEIIANVALGTGAAALGVAVVLIITGQPERAAPATKAAVRAVPLWSAAAGPLPGGGRLFLRGTF